MNQMFNFGQVVMRRRCRRRALTGHSRPSIGCGKEGVGAAGSLVQLPGHWYFAHVADDCFHLRGIWPPVAEPVGQRFSGTTEWPCAVQLPQIVLGSSHQTSFVPIVPVVMLGKGLGRIVKGTCYCAVCTVPCAYTWKSCRCEKH